MRALRDHGRSMWHLAGHWYFDRPLKEFRKLARPDVDEVPLALLKAVDPLTQSAPGVPSTHAQNKAAVLCSYILWEALFPEELGNRGLIDAMRPMLELSDRPDQLLLAIETFTRMPDGIGYAIMFDFRVSNAVRLAQGEEGGIEFFEAQLARRNEDAPEPG